MSHNKHRRYGKGNVGIYNQYTGKSSGNPVFNASKLKNVKFDKIDYLKETRSRLDEEQTSRLDAILIHPLWGLLIFIAVIWTIFYCTFHIGSYPQAGIEWLMDKSATALHNNIANNWLNDFLTQGVIMGLGSVLAFLPNILILFFFLSLLEETQYLPRAAKLMDRYMHHIGLHGSSFIPLLMGFGCNVPAILATRTIKRKYDRILTMLMIPYIPCSARIPTFLLFSGIFFPHNQVLVLSLLYFGGIITGILMALIFKKIF